MDQIFCDATWSDWAKNKIVSQLKDSYISKCQAISFLSLFVIVLKSIFPPLHIFYAILCYPIMDHKMSFLAYFLFFNLPF